MRTHKTTYTYSILVALAGNWRELTIRRAAPTVNG